MITRLKYTGATPGTDSNTYVLFSTASPSAGVAGACPMGNWGPAMCVHSFHWDIKHSQAGTVRGYHSSDRGATWTQFYDTGSLAAPTYTDKDVVLVEGFADFKFEWVNGGTAQATWVVNMDVSLFP
jgi:hypothetical protein